VGYAGKRVQAVDEALGVSVADAKLPSSNGGSAQPKELPADGRQQLMGTPNLAQQVSGPFRSLQFDAPEAEDESWCADIQSILHDEALVRNASRLSCPSGLERLQCRALAALPRAIVIVSGRCCDIILFHCCMLPFTKNEHTMRSAFPVRSRHCKLANGWMVDVTAPGYGASRIVDEVPAERDGWVFGRLDTVHQCQFCSRHQ
jgi:hypothetical protein